MLTQDVLLHNHPPSSYSTNSIRKVKIRTPSASMCTSSSYYPTKFARNKNRTNNKILVKLDIKTLNRFITPD